MRISKAALVCLTMAMASGVASETGAQRYPDDGSRTYRPPAESRTKIRGGVPGRFDYYALVLSWSPTHCATVQRPDEMQCDRRDGRKFAFVLHGLWPQYERGFPDSCPTRERPFVPNSTIDRIMDIMPSRGLVIHEYRKHGVCSGLAPDAYFALARSLFQKIRIPPRFVDPTNNQMVDTVAVIGEFVSANPGLRPQMLAVSCAGTGNRLREVRICISREGQFRECGSNESQRRLCGAPRVFVPPVRQGRGADPLERRR
jgi:ribonuclease T2